jgi:copper homeostasis protein
MTLLEVCIDSADGLEAALKGGADRVELCSVLELGGLTPSPGLIALAAQRGATARAMIRPRAGDFAFTPADVEMMKADIDAARRYRIEGVVLGANHPDGRLDLGVLGQLTEAARGMKLTLHRAFDLVPDITKAVEEAVSLGFDTILTSGRASAAPDGLDDLITAHRVAAGRITIMAGAGISPDNVRTILEGVPLGAIHGSCSAPALPDSAPAAKLGFTSPQRRVTDSGRVAALKHALI